MKVAKDKILLKPVKAKYQGKILYSEEAPWGRGKSGLPHVKGEILQIGEDVESDEIGVGREVILDGMNATNLKHEGEEYYVSNLKAVLAVVVPT